MNAVWPQRNSAQKMVKGTNATMSRMRGVSVESESDDYAKGHIVVPASHSASMEQALGALMLLWVVRSGLFQAARPVPPARASHVLCKRSIERVQAKRRVVPPASTAA
ncbi:hypothetical protein S40288_10618 [Stachybotrys chartarum IBT 40288]|nr:hypothetical protein S40288_10618 [Stachybotrys chartarum IBT 40288]